MNNHDIGALAARVEVARTAKQKYDALRKLRDEVTTRLDALSDETLRTARGKDLCPDCGAQLGQPHLHWCSHHPENREKRM